MISTVRGYPLDILSAMDYASRSHASETSKLQPQYRSGGAALTLLQPHSDDVALSISGSLQRWRGEIDIITLFSSTGSDADVRAFEDNRFAEMHCCGLTRLDLPQSSRSNAPEKTTQSNRYQALAERMPCIEGALAGPIGVGSHPDHIAASAYARDNGAALLWEDVAFWGIYGSSVEDRLELTETSMTAPSLVAIGIEVSGAAKAAALRCYPSQSQDIWRPIRYARAVAREHHVDGHCERVFIDSADLPWLEEGLGVRTIEGPSIQYGHLRLETRIAPWENRR